MTTALCGWSEDEQRAIREQVDRILASDAFVHSRRRRDFLSYIIGETLAGRGERLKGYTVAVEVFARPQSFDPAVDPVVRIEAGRLRDKLREYYETEGQGDPIRIDLPKGSYAPHIAFRNAVAADAPLDEGGAAVSGASDASARSGENTAAAPAGWTWHAWRTWAIPAVASILVTGIVGAWLSLAPVRSVTGTDSEAEIDMPAGPAIAVMPFVNLSGDPKQDYFSDGLTEDILTELSRARELRVLARNSTFPYKEQEIDIAELGRALKVRYVLHGSVQRTGAGVRVTAQLIDTTTGAHVWTDRFDRGMADIFLIQDEIVSQIFARIAGFYGVIETTEARSATRKSPEEIQAYDLVLRAREVMQWDWSSANISLAKTILLEAVALDPTNAQARCELAWLAVIGRAFRYDKTPMLPEEILDQANKAVLLDPASARAHMVAAAAGFYMGQVDVFEHEAEQALKLAPYDAHIMGVLGFMTAASGDWERGVAMAVRANALNPGAVAGWYHATVFYDAYLKGDYQRALEITRQDTNREAPYVLVAFIPTYGQLGLKEQALACWRKLRAHDPNWSAATFDAWWRSRNLREEDIAKLMDGVRKSGVLDATASPAP